MTYARVCHFFLDFSAKLLTDTELFDDCTIALDVFCLQVIQHATTFTNEGSQGALCTEVLTVFLQVLGQVVDTEGEQCDLALSRTGVLSIFAILSKKLSFFLRSQIHDVDQFLSFTITTEAGYVITTSWH